MKRQERVVLTNTLPGHNKYYIVMPVKDGKYFVRYGAIGSDGTNVRYEDRKKNRILQIKNKTLKGYQIQDEDYKVGDLVTLDINGTKVEAFITDTYISGYQSVIRLRTREVELTTNTSSIIMHWKVDEDNTAIYNLTMPFLIELRREFLTAEGYLQE